VAVAAVAMRGFVFGRLHHVVVVVVMMILVVGLKIDGSGTKVPARSFHVAI